MPWVPTDLGSTLVRWYKAHDIAITNGTAFAGAWDDRSAAAVDTDVQTDSTARPIFRTGGQNGKSYLEFDGSNDTLLSTNPASVDDLVTMFVVCEPSTVSGFRTLVQGKYGLQTSGLGAGDEWGMYGGSAGAALTAATPYVLKAANDFINGVNKFQANATKTTTAYSNAGEGKSYLAIGSNDGGGQFFEGKLYELLVCDTLLSDTDADLVMDYLGTEYALLTSTAPILLSAALEGAGSLTAVLGGAPSTHQVSAALAGTGTLSGGPVQTHFLGSDLRGSGFVSINVVGGQRSATRPYSVTEVS